MERFIAIDNVCAWPNLTLLPDGTILAAIYNQPCHGIWEGDLEGWFSTDGGCRWEKRGVIAPHATGTARYNHAVGMAHDGAIVALVSGYGPVPPPGVARDPQARPRFLTNWVCRSYDSGRSWQRNESVALPAGASELIPFGDVERSPDGALGATAYAWNDGKANTVYFLRSHDDGHTWGEAVIIGPGDYNETDVLCLGNQRWLAAARTRADQHLDLFVSEDGGGRWSRQAGLTLPRQHPGHLLRLADGRILLTYGIRNRGLYGVGARLSNDEGRSWGPPIVLVDLEDASDGGYPSSVQLANGVVVTAYYANRIAAHHRYHMGVVRWQVDGQ